MKPYKPSELPKTGSLILLYGESGIGKTVTAIIEGVKMAMAQKKMAVYIAIENRNLDRNIEVVQEHFNMTRLELDEWLHIETSDSDFEDVIKYLCTGKNFKGVIIVIFDSITQMMCTDLTLEVLEQAYNARSDADKSKKALTGKSKMTEEGYGTLAINMMRLMKQLEVLSARGRYVIATALTDSNPSWAKSLEYAPAITGKKFGTTFPGKCDFIGYVQRKKDKITRREIYPPLVSYEVKSDTHLVKWTGLSPLLKGERMAPIKMPLDLSLMFPDAMAGKNITQTDVKPEA